MSDAASSVLGGSDVDVDMDTETLINSSHSVAGSATPRPELINENAPVNIMPFLGRTQQGPERYDVTIIGAGPAGLMLGLVLARLGITPLILDERSEQTPAGRADGLQPKSIETLRMLNIADELLRSSVRVYDMCLWHSAVSKNDRSHFPEDPDQPVQMRRVGREVHYPAFIVDLIDPFILVGHQGMVEKVFVDDLAKRGFGVRRCHRFDGLTARDDGKLEVQARFNVTQDVRRFETSFVVGCDGAHSRVRKLIVPSEPGVREDFSEMSVWGVLDGEVDTDFPDIWSKTVVFSERFGSILIIPRERDMTRLYIEMRPDAANPQAANANPAIVQAAIMRRAAQILLPYRIRWRSVEWFGQYRVSQRVAPRFASSISSLTTSNSARQQTPDPTNSKTDTRQPSINNNTPSPQVFIAGDAAHTHSPKAAQGMNTALHDSWNLAWKLNLAVRGLARPPVLLDTYSAERKKIAHDLITFDLEHANEMSHGDPATLADNFRRNVRFISGVGCEYGINELNLEPEDMDQRLGALGALGARPGATLPPGKVRRYIDANPVDLQLDIPVLGQFRVYFFVPDILSSPSASFLMSLCDAIAEPQSLMSRLSAAASRSYLERPRVPSSEDLYIRPDRYTAVSQLFAFALITSTQKHLFEIAHLPPILSRSPWTIYLDDVPDLDTRGSTCAEKYLGPQVQDEVTVMNVRPDGYVGSLRKWKVPNDHSGDEAGVEAARWLDRYYDGFLQVPSN